MLRNIVNYVVKFATFKSRDAVLQAARATKPRGVYVNEDFSSRVMSRRKELLPEMRVARERGRSRTCSTTNSSSRTGWSASNGRLAGLSPWQIFVFTICIQLFLRYNDLVQVMYFLYLYYMVLLFSALPGLECAIIYYYVYAFILKHGYFTT